MTEKEKRLNGELYVNNGNEDFFKELIEAKEKCFKYNNIAPSNLEERKKVLKEILGKTKESYYIEQPFYCDFGYNIEIGENFFANYNLTILDCNKVIFGDNVFIGPNCGFYAAAHPLDFESRNKGLEYAKPIVIGDNVWIGGSVVVLPGVKIGNGSVIGAGSVVTKDIPDNVVAAGNPCKVIKRIDNK